LKKIALIACSNGYGHIRRLLILADALIKNNSDPVLFAPAYTVRHIVKTEDVLCPKTFDFDTQTSRENWLDGTAINWVDFAPDLDNFDIVISDNLIETLLIRPDAWLSGSFFWHDSLKYFPQNLKLQALDLLRKYNPRMISSSMFTSDMVKLHTQLFEVGLFTSQVFHTKHINKNDVLIACGKGGGVTKQTKEFVELLATREKVQFQRVWVEPEILPQKHPDWMIPASFKHEMYQSILAAVIRPGIGTVTNSLFSNARVFPFYEYSNKEMRLNALKVQSYGVGEDSTTIDNAMHQAELFAVDRKAQENHLKKIQAIDMDGAQQAADIILHSI
jgi:hypothetical protein